jgi:carboxyl-terminal processing protease
MKNIISKSYGPIIISISIIFGILIGSNIGGGNDFLSMGKYQPTNQKVQRLIKYINSDYVDEVNTDSILDVAINNILINLDPHSTYIPASNHQKVKENMAGSFVGIGVEFRVFRDTILVVNVIDGGPSQQYGLQNGDRILMADNDTLYNKLIDSDYAMSKLKGQSGTAVNLTIYRPADDEILNKEVIRGDVPIKSVDASYMVNDTLGYIKINRFAATTFDEFDLALDQLLDKKATSLIIDLRDNLGGYMHAAKLISNEFLEKDQLIVYTKDKNGTTDESYADGEGRFKEGKVYVFLNEKSASASEVVAGALQDNDRGIIVGRRSFGKGLVQQELSLGDGSAVRLTTARYYTPTGRSIQKPYSAGAGTYEYQNDYFERIHSGELVEEDSIKIDESLKYTTLKGKIVYGGGGIIPDIFVPIDTSAYEHWIYSAIKEVPVSELLFDYADYNRNELVNKGFDSFKETFNIEKEVYPMFIRHLKNSRVKVSNSIEENNLLKLRLKAYLAKLIWSDQEMYAIWDLNDKMIQKVLKE